MAVSYTRASSEDELRQILVLQQKNAMDALTSTEKEQEGFVTVLHSSDVLKRMNDACPHIIAKDRDSVVGYALVMLKEFSNEIPLLSAMFKTANELLGDKDYVAMGQICISKEYRKQGIFRGMYFFYKKELEHKFDGLLTEVAANNSRSSQAHLTLGFEILKTQVTDGISWELIYWDWK